MKKLLLSFFLLCTVAWSYAADSVWCMITNTGQAIELSNVSYILAEGTAPETFSIVLKSGNPIENVGKVKFAQATPTGIAHISSDDMPMLTQYFDGQLTISNVAPDLPIRVYSLNGQLLRSGITSSSSTTIDISNLTPGVYVLKVGGNALKFMKK